MPGARVPASEAPAVWARFLAELWRWVAEHGDARVPTATVLEVDGAPYMLGSRVRNARVYYHRGSLSELQVGQLEALPGWSWDGYRGFSAAIWRQRLVELRAYVAEHGSLSGLDQTDPSLSSWLRTQRHRTLTTAEHDELSAIPRALEVPTAILDDFLDLLQRWTAAMPGRDAGHLLRSTRITVDGRRVRLGERAGNWRRRYRDGSLSEGDAARLEAVPGWSWELQRPGRRPRAIEQLGRD